MFSQFLFYEYLLNLLLRFQTAKPKQAPNFECKGSFPFRRFRRSRFVVRQRQTRWSIWLVTRNPLLNLNSEPQKNNWLRCEASKLALRFQEVLGFIKRLNGERSLQYLTFRQSFIHYSKNSCEWVIVSAWNQSTVNTSQEKDSQSATASRFAVWKWNFAQKRNEFVASKGKDWFLAILHTRWVKIIDMPSRKASPRPAIAQVSNWQKVRSDIFMALLWKQWAVGRTLR